MDDKTLRGASRPDGQIHLLSALDTSTGIVLAQVTIAAKSNEIPAFTPLLDAVAAVLGDLTGVIFVADALHAQTEHARQVAARGAHLLVQVKANQPTLHTQLKRLPWAQVPAGDRTRNRGHGRRAMTLIAAARNSPAFGARNVQMVTAGTGGGPPRPGRLRMCCRSVESYDR